MHVELTMFMKIVGTLGQLKPACSDGLTQILSKTVCLSLESSSEITPEHLVSKCMSIVHRPEEAQAWCLMAYERLGHS